MFFKLYLLASDELYKDNSNCSTNSKIGLRKFKFLLFRTGFLVNLSSPLK